MRHAAGELAHHLHFLRLDELLLQPPPVAAFIHFLYGAPHFRDEPGEMILQDIIRRAALEQFDALFFVHRPGHEDERHIGKAGARHFQHLQPVEIWQRKV